MGRGAFIVVEGLDRCGKTTQVALLSRYLDAVALKFPDRSTKLGGIINLYLAANENLDDHAIHLIFSANRWELKDKITHALNEGKNVIVDRYIYSGVAFSAAKGLDAHWCLSPDIGLPQPDLVVYLTLSPEEAAKRDGFGQERYENKQMQDKVGTIFTNFANHVQNWTNVDASGSIEEVRVRILKVVEKTLRIVKEENFDIKSIAADSLGPL